MDAPKTAVDAFLERIHQQLLPELTALQLDRAVVEQKHKEVQWWWFGGLAAVGTVVFTFLTYDSFSAFRSVLGITFIVLVSYLIFFIIFPSFIRNKYRKPLKMTLINRLMEEMGPDWSFEPQRAVSRSVFENSQLFPRNQIDRYRGEDLFSGAHNNIPFEFSELHVEDKRQSRDSKGRTKTKYVTIFRGLFMSAELPLNTKFSTMVTPDYAEWMFGSWLGESFQKMTTSGDRQLIKLESPEFEKLFKVVGTDPIEARYLLTPKTMENLVALRQRLGHNLFLSVQESKLYVAINWSENLFELKIDAPLDDPSYFEALAADLFFCLDLLEEISNNWMKKA